MPTLSRRAFLALPLLAAAPAKPEPMPEFFPRRRRLLIAVTTPGNDTRYFRGWYRMACETPDLYSRDEMVDLWRAAHGHREAAS